MSITWKIIIGVLVVGLIVMTIVAFTKPKPQIIPVPPESWPAGCNPKNPGYDMSGNLSTVCQKIYCALNPGDVSICNASTDCYNGCSSSRPGYDCFGKKSAYCE